MRTYIHYINTVVCLLLRAQRLLPTTMYLLLFNVLVCRPAALFERGERGNYFPAKAEAVGTQAIGTQALQGGRSADFCSRQLRQLLLLLYVGVTHFVKCTQRRATMTWMPQAFPLCGNRERRKNPAKFPNPPDICVEEVEVGRRQHLSPSH